MAIACVQIRGYVCHVYELAKLRWLTGRFYEPMHCNTLRLINSVDMMDTIIAYISHILKYRE